MKQSSVTLRVENFRAIGKAEIKLDGITVVAGVNGCGKSTLSKLLYWVYHGVLDFDELFLQPQLKLDIKNIEKMVYSLIFQLGEYRIQLENINIVKNDIDNRGQKVLLPFLFVEFSNFNQGLENINSIFQNDVFHIHHYLSLMREDAEILDKYFNKKVTWKIKAEQFTHLQQHEQLFSTDKLVLAVDFIISLLDEIIFYSKMNPIIYPRKILENKLQQIFKASLPTNLEILEEEDKCIIQIFSASDDYLTQSEDIKEIIYIDTPMSFNHHEEEHWQDLNKKLKKRPKFNQSAPKTTEIDDLMKREILTGQAEIKFDELSESFTFRTPSGAEIDLSDSATGIKAFAVLNLLLKNGSINSKTLLILDEPEAHLHPQWVVEFGRLLTLINKHIGAKIFVATHSPDMVQALRYIPNKEDIGERVNFYLAEYNSETHLFDYQDLDGKVGKIFASFNKSLDKLEQYGEE